MNEDARDEEHVRAALRVLAGFCKIEGEVDDAGRAEFERLAGAALEASDRAAILADPGELDEAIDALTDRATRREVLRSARHIAHAHGSPLTEETAIERMRDAWQIKREPPDAEVYEGRPTDISELTRRFAHGEATVTEMVRKIREDLGES